jgi:hypothetical protein
MLSQILDPTYALWKAAMPIPLYSRRDRILPHTWQTISISKSGNVVPAGTQWKFMICFENT